MEELTVRRRGETSTSTAQAFFESAAGARHLLFTKWFVPGDQKATNDFDSSLLME
jgi:hypothetical protein